jgi:osmoprotectant transport system substrate-binding protein
LALASVTFLLLALTSCSGGSGDAPAAAGPRPILVGAFDFAESQVLASIYATALKNHGYPVELLANVASREIMEPALEQGKVDFVPEYLGTALSFIDPDSDPSYSNSNVTHAMLTEAFTAKGVDVLDYAPAQDKNEIVVTQETAKRYHLESISDLKRVSGRLAFGGPPECPGRPHCLAGLQTTYALHFQSFHPLDSGGPLTVAALRGGEIDVAVLFTTTPQIDEFDLVVLRDDRHLQPSENVVPVVRRSVVVEQGPDFVDLIDRVTAEITSDELRALNRRVESEDPAAVASDWLLEQGLAG